MKRLYITKLLFIIGVFSLFTIGCSDENDYGSPGPRPKFVQFSPASAKAGEQVVITGSDLANVKKVYFGEQMSSSVLDISKNTPTSLTITVPSGFAPGKTAVYVWNTGGAMRDTFTIIEPTPTITKINEAKIRQGDSVTVVGTNLITVNEVKVGVEVTGFKKINSTSIKVKIPETTAEGESNMTVTHTGGSSSVTLIVLPQLLPLPVLPYYFYDDQLENNWEDWGWSAATDNASKKYVRDGQNSKEKIYTNWGGVKFFNTSVATTGFTSLDFWLYGETGTSEKEINVSINSGGTVTIKVTEGDWMSYSIPLSDLGSPSTINEILFQNKDWSGTVYFDHVGLK